MQQLQALLSKEILIQLRSPLGVYTALLFGFIVVVALAFAAFNQKIHPNLAAGVLWVAISFAAVISVPNLVAKEEETRTADLLRLSVSPFCVYWAKTLYAAVSLMLLSLFIAFVFLLLTTQSVYHLGLMLVSLSAGVLSLSGIIVLCGLLASQSTNQGALTGVVGLPLLFPVIAMGIASMGPALSSTPVSQGWVWAGALGCYAALMLASGPYVFAAIWKT
jgi:heme exporter protein CcmB